jgi:pimeloyl-ACP methyl ester carboxylesterase
MAPHVIVEEITIAAIRETRAAFETGELRRRMERHHDPDVAFRGWCGVWLDPAFAVWSLEEEARGVTAPMLLIQGAEDPYGTLEQLDRIEAAVGGKVCRLVVGGGHSPHLERQAKVVTAIERFAEPLD